jgi:hypothetical protein
MTEQEILDKIVDALKQAAKGNGIELKDVRIKISYSAEQQKLIFEIMNKTQIVCDTTIAKMFNLMAVIAFMVVNRVEQKFNMISKDNNISKEELNIRISMGVDSPNAYMFKNGERIRQIQTAEII